MLFLFTMHRRVPYVLCNSRATSRFYGYGVVGIQGCRSIASDLILGRTTWDFLNPLDYYQFWLHFLFMVKWTINGNWMGGFPCYHVHCVEQPHHLMCNKQGLSLYSTVTAWLHCSPHWVVLLFTVFTVSRFYWQKIHFSVSSSYFCGKYLHFVPVFEKCIQLFFVFFNAPCCLWLKPKFIDFSADNVRKSRVTASVNNSLSCGVTVNPCLFIRKEWRIRQGREMPLIS